MLTSLLANHAPYAAGVSKAAAAPKLNGRGDAACWRNLPALELSVKNRDADIKEKGFARLLWDDRNLYVFIWVQAKNMAMRKKIPAAPPEGNIWLYDCLEIFVDPGRTRKYYCHLACNCLGKVYSASARVGRGIDTAWASGWKTAVSKGRDFWSLEAAIPFDSLGLHPRAGDVWGFNVVRANQAVTEVSAWRPTLTVHNPSAFGRLIFFGSGCLAGVHKKQVATQRAGIKAGLGRLRQAGLNLKASGRDKMSRKYLGNERVELDGRISECKKALKYSGDYLAICRNILASAGLLDEAHEFCGRIARRRIYDAFFCPGSTGALRGYAVCVENAMDKIPAKGYFGSPVKTAQLQLAGREYGSFQLGVLAGPGRRLTGLSINISKLIDKGGRALVGARIDAYRIDYIATAEIQPPAQRKIPDALWPGRQFRFKQPVETVGLWFDVYLPPGAPAGKYRAAISVMPDNCQEMEIPVTVEVLPFSLPLKSSLPTAFCFVDYWAEEYYGKKMPDEKRYEYIRFLLEHRLEPMNLWARDRLDMDEKYLAWAAERGKSMMFLKIENARDSARYCRDLIKKFRGRLKPIFFGHDEVLHSGSAEKLAGMKADYKLAGKKFPEVSRLNTSEIDPRLYGYVTCWCPLFSNYNPTRARERRAKGEQVWWYTTDYPLQPYANFNLDSPGVDPRIIPWMTWKVGASGLLYWGLNREWLTNAQEAERLTDQEKEIYRFKWLTPAIWGKMKRGLRWPEIPWVPYFRSVTSKDSPPSRTNGGGNLMYPGPDWLPLPSIRLKNLRDGLQDYEYFIILRKNIELVRKLGKYPALIARVEKALKIDDQIVAGATSYTKNPTTLCRARQRLAKLIVQTQEILKNVSFIDHKLFCGL